MNRELFDILPGLQREDLDARRATVGLPPWERAAVRSEGGAPAEEDYADYRRRAEDWARRVGWRE
jgi:hypothetical protein